MTELCATTSMRRPGRVVAIAVTLLVGILPAQDEVDSRREEAMVFHAFPEADSFRRIVHDVDQHARTEVERQLPFKLHFNELGPHTLFVAFRGSKPVGLVYVRSEEAEWGLAELAWALTLDQRVQGFQFQRARSHQLRELERSPFAKSLVGRDFVRVLELLQDDKRDPALVPAGAEALAKTVLRSCAKAVLVTDTVWSDEIARLQDTAMGYDAFPEAERFQRRVGQFDLGIGDTHQSVAVNVIHAFDRTNCRLGSAIRTAAKVNGEPTVLCWVVDRNLRIQRVMPPQSWDNGRLRATCLELGGHLLSSPPLGDNPLAPLAQGLGALVPQLDATRGSR